MMPQFPVIKNKVIFIGTIKHKEEIGILDKGDFTVIQYNVEKPDTFDSDELLECRGIVFCNKTGNVLRRPFEKFYNINQKEHTQENYLDKTRKIIRCTKKLDGTMISPFIVNNEIFWGTKRCADNFNEYIKASGIITAELERFVRVQAMWNRTPIFEYHDPTFDGTCIVVKYPEKYMRLLAIRSNETGEYLNIENITKYYNIDVLSEYSQEFNSFSDAVKKVQKEEHHEGYVIEMDNGKRVKLKTFWYCQRHRLIDFFSTPWKMRKLIADYMQEHDNGTVEDILLWNPEFDGDGDDVIANMSELQHNNFNKELCFVQYMINNILKELETYRDYFSTKKEMGLYKEFNGKNLLFKCFDDTTNLKSLIIQELRNKHFISSRNNTRWEEMVDRYRTLL